MSQRSFSRNISDECHQQMRAFANAGNDVIQVAFAPGGGNRFSILTRSGAYFNRNIPDECHQQMEALSKGGAKIACVAFPPGGGNRFSIVNDRGQYFNRNIPEECHQKMAELSRNGAKIVLVAFPPQGGNSWSLVNDKGVYFNRNIPEECHTVMGQMSQNGTRVICVAFDKDGSGWSVINNQGAYFNRNIPDEAHMIMGYYSQIYGSIRSIAFDGDANGWSVLGAFTKDEKVCDATRCVDIAEVYANIQQRLAGKVVGYACTVGAGSIGAYSSGYARTSADSPAKLYLPSTKSPTASVSKVVTALGAITVLAKNKVSLDTAVGSYLPSDWNVNAQMAKITFRQLLAQSSGIKDYGNNDQSYETLKSFWHAPAADAFNAEDKSREYSNYNFSIFRILLPRVDGFVDDPLHRPEKYAASYIRLVQKHVFEKVGAYDVDAKPPASGPQATGYAFSYKFPGTSKGHDWGDNTLGVGPACWYLSIDDVAKVLYSLNRNDGRILTSAQLAEMEKDGLGFDYRTDANGYRWLEKNGGWGWNSTTISTSVCLFGPGVFGALFINSDVLGAGLQNNWQWCKKCQAIAFAGNASLGDCPAGGLHDHTGSRNYCIAMNGPVPPGSQGNWRWCNKCQALCFAGSQSLGQCSGGGMHDHTGSGDYILPIRATGGAVPLDFQENFRWCNKCQVLSWGGASSPGPCQAGGEHNHTGSGNYMVGYVVGADAVLHDALVAAYKPKA